MKWVAPRTGFDEVLDRRGHRRAHYEALIFTAFDGPVRASAARRKFAQGVVVPAGAPLDEQVRAGGRHIREHFTYQRHVTSYESTRDDFLAAGAGVCQDFRAAGAIGPPPGVHWPPGASGCRCRRPSQSQCPGPTRGEQT